MLAVRQVLHKHKALSAMANSLLSRRPKISTTNIYPSCNKDVQQAWRICAGSAAFLQQFISSAPVLNDHYQVTACGNSCPCVGVCDGGAAEGINGLGPLGGWRWGISRCLKARRVWSWLVSATVQGAMKEVVHHSRIHSEHRRGLIVAIDSLEIMPEIS